MIDGLLSTKFHNPLTAGYLTPRPRLDALLDESVRLDCRLVVVTAPAGFGKSTLVGAWMNKQSAPFSWLSLDKNDNEPSHFLSYLVGALQKIDPLLGASQVNRIRTADTADREAVYTDVMIALVNEMANQPDRFTLVLDDCHILKDPLLIRLLIFLIEHQPLQMRLVLLTREDLPLPLARLRVRRQVVEIRQSDLQFTMEEAEDFLCTGMGITRLSDQDILALEQRTEGWIAGLQLAGLSLKYEADPSHFIQSFTGSNRYILDYLLEEVFAHQPIEIKNFLLSTSVLDRFCAPLCDEMLLKYKDNEASENGTSQMILEQIERANLFLIPLDQQRQWYRYHHLFAELLRHALAQLGAEKEARLHLAASQWLEMNGYIQEAVKHAFQTQNLTYAAELVERHAWNMILHSQVGFVFEWCASFPEAVIRARPVLCIFHAWALAVTFRKENHSAARERLDQAASALARVDPNSLANLVDGAPPVLVHRWVSGQITFLQSMLLISEPRQQADPQLLIKLGQLAYEQLPEEAVSARSTALLNLCYAAQALSDADGAEEKFKQVIRVALSGGNYFGAMIAEFNRAYGLYMQGKLDTVAEFCEQKKQSYGALFKQPVQELPAIALLDQMIGIIHLERNQLDEAEAFLQRGLAVGQWMPRQELPGYLALARLGRVKGDAQEMEDALRRLEMRWPDIRYCTQAVRLLYQLQDSPNNSGTRKDAADWTAANQPKVGPGFLVPGIGAAWNDLADYTVYTAWAQMQILLGSSAEALNIIQPMLTAAIEHNLIHRIIELSLLQAQANYVLGQRERVWKPLRLALTHAEKAGYLRIVDQGPILVPLLSEAARLGMSPQYILRILENVQPGQGHQATLLEPAEIQASLPVEMLSDGLVEPLSTREIEILELLASGFSIAQVASKLYLSPNTLKAHTQNIYGKLAVHSRVQAVNKARELKLIA